MNPLKRLLNAEKTKEKRSTESTATILYHAAQAPRLGDARASQSFSERRSFFNDSMGLGAGKDEE